MLLHQRLLFKAFLAMLLVAGLHFLALRFYFYWQWWWFDILMHFLGGVVVGLGALWALYGFSFIRKVALTSGQLCLGVFLCTLIVGLGWEIYEFYFGLYVGSFSIADTSLDILMDLFGATVAYHLTVSVSFKVL